MSFKEVINEQIKLVLGKQKNHSGVNDFIEEFHASSQEHPFHRSTRIYKMNSIDLSPDGNDIHIHDIVSLDPNKGHGSNAIKGLTELADKHKVDLSLFAKAYTKDPKYITKTKTLETFYKKHGFEKMDGNHSDGVEMKYFHNRER